MTGSGPPGWVADPSVRWRILLTAHPEPGSPWPGDDELVARLASLHDRHRPLGWPGRPALVHDADVRRLQRRLAEDDRAPVVLGRADDGALVVSAHHGWVDGLGLLDALAEVTGRSVASSARGVGRREAEGGRASTTLRRLREAALTPPASVPGARRTPGPPGEALATRRMEGKTSTATLVGAAVRAVLTRDPGARHVAVAVGAARRDHDSDPSRARLLADRSELVRLTDVERLDQEQVAAAVRTAPLQPRRDPASAAGVLARAEARALRLLAGRLGSTLLVSHLGETTGPGLAGLEFHPVTAGGTGLSLGAVALAGRTTLTLRARARTWDDDGLEQLLEAVVAELSG